MAADENQTILEATTINSQESSAASGVSSAPSSGKTDTAAQTGVVSVTDADSSGSAKAAITGKPFVYPAYQPVVEGLDGLRLDFSHGARVAFPESFPEGRRLVILDEDSGTCLCDAPIKPGSCLETTKKYYLRYRVMIGDTASSTIIWSHTLDLKDRDVLVQMPYEGAIGDSIAWFSVVERFQKQHSCRLHLLLPPKFRELFEPCYPDIHFVTYDEAKELRPYASYYLAVFFKGDEDWQPLDFRFCGLAETAGRILGLRDLSNIHPRVRIGPRTIHEPYVCIGTVGSANAKCWNNPHGWIGLVEYLKSCGYRVLCIDKERVNGCGDVWRTIPYGAEDFTGDRPLQERVDLIGHADFFVGLTSGLSWLAWCTGVPVVMIVGITSHIGDFGTPYLVQSRIACHGCWNDPRCDFDHHDFLWCPRHKGTPRAYECTRSISVRMVADVISRIPGARRPPEPPAKSEAPAGPKTGPDRQLT